MAGSDAVWAGNATEVHTHEWITYFFAGLEKIAAEEEPIGSVPCPIPIQVGDSASNVAKRLRDSFNVKNANTPYSAELVGPNRDGVRFMGGTVALMTIDEMTVGSGTPSPVAGMTVVQETAPI